MTKALVLMKALPPTKGHKALIQFAEFLADEVTILIDTDDDERMQYERIEALWAMSKPHTTEVVWWRDAPQDPESPDFWDEWGRKLIAWFGHYDIVVGSEPYCERVAKIINARYMPYDPDRELLHTKATDIRNKPIVGFADVAEEFQDYLKTTVTVFGAESNGKTTLSKELAAMIGGHWLFEWARPYLENAENIITRQSMTEIWKGQYAAQCLAGTWKNKPYLIQDTDLYTTIGYWEQPHWIDALGPVPSMLITDACFTKSDLYIILKSNIPFEVDPLRYGGDHRESDDAYWISVAEKYNLNYVVIDESAMFARVSAAMAVVKKVAEEKTSAISYDRQGR